MSFAVIQTGGKQYKVKTSDIIKIEKLDQDTASKIEFNQVLAYGNGNILEVGSPIVDGAKVEAELIKNAKNRTVLIFKKRRRKNSRRKNGHRQQYSLIKIKKIFSKDGAVFAEAKKDDKKEVKNKEENKE
jgi:large subunit ribosomal protein L21